MAELMDSAQLAEIRERAERATMRPDETARRIREHSQIHQGKERNAHYITIALDMAADAVEAQPALLAEVERLNAENATLEASAKRNHEAANLLSTDCKSLRAENSRLRAELADEKDNHASTIILRDSMYAEKDAEIARLQTEKVRLENEADRLRMLAGLAIKVVHCERCEKTEIENARLARELGAAKGDLHLFAQCVTCEHTYDGGMRCRVPIKAREHKGDYCVVWQWRGAPSPGEGERGGGTDGKAD